MVMPVIALVVGLILLVWSADRFVEGAAATARHHGMPPLLVGMVILGFGTSAPEMVVSVLAAWQGNPGIALGNAYGSNITNIALILGVTALMNPIAVHSQVVRKELPTLAAVTALAAFQLRDGVLSRLDGVVLLGVFGGLMGWTVWQGLRTQGDPLEEDVDQELVDHAMSAGRALAWMIAGLVFLVLSSRLLVWGAVAIARGLGVSDLIVGLTVVAVGTSLPELASSVMASRKGEHDLALGNVLGSNLFNTLAVVGLAGVIQPLAPGAEVLHRDVLVMAGLTLALFAMTYGFRQGRRISRWEGGLLLACYVAYTTWLVLGVVRPAN